jgi:nitrite reductase/ring-hydroxylating ferredoxin subunit
VPNKKWFKVCAVDALKPESARSVKLFGRPFAVFFVDGSYYGTDGACRHMKADLAGGKLDRFIIECPMHGWQYDVRSGKCLTQPDSDIKTLPVKIENNQIWIQIEIPQY